MGQAKTRAWRRTGLLVSCASIGMAGAALAGGIVGDGTPGSCTDAALAAALVGGGTVSFDCGEFAVIPVSTHVVASGDVTVIEGSNATLDGQNLNRHFVVEPGASLTLRFIEMMNGESDRGGSVLNQGDLSIESSRIFNGRARSGGDGGAIYNDLGAQLTIVDSFFENVLAEGRGGAVYSRGTASLLRVEFQDLRAEVAGAAIAVDAGSLEVDLSRMAGTTPGSGGVLDQGGGAITLRRSLLGGSAEVDGGTIRQTAGTLALENVSLYDGQAPRGGALFSNGDVSLRNTTFHQNMGDAGGSLFIAPSGSVTAVNTLFSETLRFDSTPGLHCAGLPLTSLGHNLASDASCNLVGAGDLPSAAPQIVPDPGGPWGFVLAPSLGSPALDAGDDAACPATDQRDSMSRPQDGGSGAALCDIGAIEVVPEPGLAGLLSVGVAALSVLGRRERATKRP